MTLHGDDPAVEDLGGVGLLTAKVVNQVDAVIGLELERSVVNLGMGIVGEIEHLEREFAAGNDKRAAAFEPASVVRQLCRKRGHLALRIVDLLVINGVVQLNNIALALERVGHKYRLGVNTKKGLCQCGFPIPSVSLK